MSSGDIDNADEVHEITASSTPMCTPVCEM